jgi:hypothetical protein
MFPVLCVDPNCYQKNQHKTTCQPTTPPCKGCQPHPTEPGLNLCEYHHQRLTRNLESWPHLWDRLDAAIHPTNDNHGPNNNIDPPIPINPEAVDTKHDATTILAGWANMMCEERGWTPPTRHTPTLATILAYNTPWLAAHPAAADVSTEIRDITSRAQRIIHPTPTTRIHLGTCPRQDCDGTTTATLHPGTNLSAKIRCTAGHTWAPDQWIGLGVTQGVLGDTATLAKAAGRSVRTIQRLTQQGVITPVCLTPPTGPGRPKTWYQLAPSIQALLAHRPLTDTPDHGVLDKIPDHGA